MRGKRQLITALFGAALMLAPMLTPAGAFASPPPQTAKQDMKNAGHHTKDAARNAGRGVKTGTNKAYHSTKRGTKRAWHKTKNGTKGAVNGARQGARNPH